MVKTHHKENLFQGKTHSSSYQDLQGFPSSEDYFAQVYILLREAYIK